MSTERAQPGAASRPPRSPAAPRIKRTFNIPDDVVLLLSEIQIQRYRATGKKPELSELVTEGIRLLADHDQALAS